MPNDNPTITIRWNGDEAKVSYSQRYKDSVPILKADMLKDAIADLKQEYKQVLDGGLYEKI